MKQFGLLRRILLAYLLGWIYLTPAALAQSGRRTDPPLMPEKSEDSPLVRVKTSEVLLSVTVRNQFGHLATDLTQRDFIVIEDGARQDITSFNVRRLPINVVLVLDASGSVFSEMKAIRESAVQFVQQMRPDDRISIIQFADKIELIQDWTSNADDLKHALNWRYRPGKETHLWDAVFLAADEQLKQVEGRKAIIILTDADDTASKITPEQAYWASVKSEASIYVISKTQEIINRLVGEYGGFGGRISGVKGKVDAVVDRLKRAEAEVKSVAEKTGGRIFSPVKPEELAKAYLQVAEELQNQYLITYTPTNDKRDGTYRSVKVFITRTGLDVNAKEGYIAPTE